MRNKDFVSDGFLAVTVAGLVPVLELAHSRIYLKTQFASERRPCFNGACPRPIGNRK